MPITKITIANFKGVENRVEIPLRPITLLFGGNSAGKSTMIHAMMYLAELLERKNANADSLASAGKSIDLGGFRQLVHNHDISRIVTVGVTVTVDDDGLPIYPVTQSASAPDPERDAIVALSGIKEVEVSLNIKWHAETNSPWIVAYKVAINGTSAGVIVAQPTQVAELIIKEDHPIFAQVFPDQQGQFEPGGRWDSFGNEIVGQLGYLGTPSYIVGDTVVPQWGRSLELLTTPSSEDSVFMEAGDATKLFSQIFVGAGECVLAELRRIRYIGPLRIIPARNFRSVLSPDEGRWSDGSAAWDLLHKGDNELNWFNAKQLAALGLGYRFDRYRFFEVPCETVLGGAIESVMLGLGNGFDAESVPASDFAQIIEKSRMKLISEETGLEVDPSDVGVGVSQLMPVVIGAMAPGYSLLAVEQPELHIHPAIQCRLADLFAHQVLNNQGRQILLETHSEHLMLRLLRRVRETAEDELPHDAPAIVPDDLAVFYVTNDNTGLTITELPVNSEGDFDKQWPKGFFEERAAELF